MVTPLAKALAFWDVEIIIGIARAGLFPAASIAIALRQELYPVRVTRRVNDMVEYKSPIWRVDVLAIVSGKTVAVADEIADTVATLALVASRALERGARPAITVSLVAHSWADHQPKLTAVTTDALVIFPWDRSVLINGTWLLHPEIQAAISNQDNASGIS